MTYNKSVLLLEEEKSLFMLHDTDANQAQPALL